MQLPPGCSRSGQSATNRQTSSPKVGLGWRQAWASEVTIYPRKLVELHPEVEDLAWFVWPKSKTGNTMKYRVFLQVFSLILGIWQNLAKAPNNYPCAPVHVLHWMKGKRKAPYSLQSTQGFCTYSMSTWCVTMFLNHLRFLQCTFVCYQGLEWDCPKRETSKSHCFKTRPLNCCHFHPLSCGAHSLRPQARDNGIAALQVQLRTAPLRLAVVSMGIILPVSMFKYRACHLKMVIYRIYIYMYVYTHYTHDLPGFIYFRLQPCSADLPHWISKILAWSLGDRKPEGCQHSLGSTASHSESFPSPRAAGAEPRTQKIWDFSSRLSWWKISILDSV